MTVVAILIIALVTIVPLAVPWMMRRGMLADVFPPSPPNTGRNPGTTAEDRIRFRLPSSSATRIDEAARGHERHASGQDILRDRVIELIERHPDRGAEVVRTWLHQE